MKYNKLFTATALALGISSSALANQMNPNISVTFDGFYKSEATALSERGSGFGLGHSELTFAGAISDRFQGRFTTVLETHDGETNIDIEEAFVDTVGLSYGLDIRFGRFLSQVGYLNERHTHHDNFSERPAAYRAMLGTHYYDDGARLNVLLPVPFFWRVGAEVFNGTSYASGTGDDDIGVYTLNTKLGGDIGASNSWQLGASYLKHNLEVEAHEEEDEDHDHGDHEHSHNSSYYGENLYIVDAVWKWAPQGNAKRTQLTLQGEYLYADDINEHAKSDDVHKGWYASAVFRFYQQWEIGVRHGSVELKEVHDDHFHDQELQESDVMIAWKRDHFSTVRLQYTHQKSDKGFKDDVNDAVTLQYVMTLGAHGAHAF